MDLNFSSSTSEVMKKEFRKSRKYQTGKFGEDVSQANLVFKKKTFEARKLVSYSQNKMSGSFSTLPRNPLQQFSMGVKIPYNQESHLDLNRSFTIPQRGRTFSSGSVEDKPFWSSPRGK